MRLTPGLASTTTALFNPAILATRSFSLLDHHLKVNRENLDMLVLSRTYDAISKVARREKSWDERGSAKPDGRAIQLSMALIQSFYSHAMAAGDITGQAWLNPHVSSSEDGEVVFEWWKDSHKLTIYVGPDSAEFLKIWGPNMATQMADGALLGAQFQGLWLWLNS